MIRNSFLFLEKVKNKMEQKLMQQGIMNWDDFLKAGNIKGLSNARKKYYERRLLEARNALYNFDSSYFIGKLPQSEMWRLYEFFKGETAFLDIETSGVNSHDYIIMVGLFDGVDTKIMIKGINLDLNHLQKELKRYKLFVTFNGASFDLPFIRKRYPNLLPNIPNFDLRVGCDRVGLNGGLKEAEKKLGISRNPIVEKMHGGDPITLWRMYKATGDDYYLRLLVEYNEEDVINLKIIAEYVVEKLKEKIIGICND